MLTDETADSYLRDCQVTEIGKGQLVIKTHQKRQMLCPYESSIMIQISRHKRGRPGTQDIPQLSSIISQQTSMAPERR